MNCVRRSKRQDLIRHSRVGGNPEPETQFKTAPEGPAFPAQGGSPGLMGLLVFHPEGVGFRLAGPFGAVIIATSYPGLPPWAVQGGPFGANTTREESGFTLCLSAIACRGLESIECRAAEFGSTQPTARLRRGLHNGFDQTVRSEYRGHGVDWAAVFLNGLGRLGADRDQFQLAAQHSAFQSFIEMFQ